MADVVRTPDPDSRAVWATLRANAPDLYRRLLRPLPRPDADAPRAENAALADGEAPMPVSTDAA